MAIIPCIFHRWNYHSWEIPQLLLIFEWLYSSTTALNNLHELQHMILCIYKGKSKHPLQFINSGKIYTPLCIYRTIFKDFYWTFIWKICFPWNIFHCRDFWLRILVSQSWWYCLHQEVQEWYLKQPCSFRFVLPPYSRRFDFLTRFYHKIYSNCKLLVQQYSTFGSHYLLINGTYKYHSRLHWLCNLWL